jgi:hypothetical protein
MLVDFYEQANCYLLSVFHECVCVCVRARARAKKVLKVVI